MSASDDQKSIKEGEVIAKKLGAAIWGAGWVSGEHAKAWQNNPHSQVVAIGSRKESSARALAERLGLDCKIYAHPDDPDKAYEQLLNDEQVDVISICTPNDRHTHEAILAAKAGKHLVIEKPISLTLDELKALRDTIRETKVKTVVSFVLRWNPLFETIKSLIAAGALGDKLFYGEVDYWHHIDTWWSGWVWAHRKDSGGSAFLLGGCHAVDAVRWFMGSEVSEVTAYAHQWDTRFEYPPTVVAALKFENGAVGKSSTTFECRMPYNFNIDLLGNKGTFRYNGDKAMLWSETLNPKQTGWTILQTIYPDSGEVTHHPFQGEIDHFVDCILNDIESHCNVEDAVHTHEVCIACDISAAEGRPVQLPLLKD